MIGESLVSRFEGSGMRAVVCWLAWALFGFTVGSIRAAETPVDFAHDVAPILKKHCVECHGGTKAEGGFSLNTRALILEAGAAMAGSARTSRMVELVASEDPDSQMPPQDRPRLSSREIAVLQSWIDGGLRWEEGFSFAAPRYEPPLKPRRPTLPQPTAGRDHPIDRIVDDYFRQHQIQRPKPISDAAFLRRVSLDTVGLLPAPERREKFLADPSSAKRERLVRELLEDELAYAEHWLTFWNDLLRNDYSGTGFITGAASRFPRGFTVR